MMKAVLVSSVLFAAVLAYDLEDFQNNIIEFKSGPIQEYIRPYPYQDNRKHMMVKAKPAKVYSDNYEVISTVPEVNIQSSGCFITTLIYNIFSMTKAGIVFIFHKVPAVIFGSIAALVGCKLSSMYNILSGVVSMFGVNKEISEIVIPQGVARAAEFVKQAIYKYNSA